MTFISNEKDIYYGGEIRRSGSPWTRENSLSRGKWKLPTDRRYRNQRKFSFDDDTEQGRRHNNRLTRYLLYLMGHPTNENEFVRLIINDNRPLLREDVEPVDTDFLKRNFPNGNRGDLYRIDDEWWFSDYWDQHSQDADWGYRGTDNPGMYRNPWMKRSNEADDDYSHLINFFKLVSGSGYTQKQIEEFLDAEAILRMTAVMGFIGDWDSFTQSRGKNAYFYRRPDTGLYQLLHWDSDLAFGRGRRWGGNRGFYYGRRGFYEWIETPYNQTRFRQYLRELIDNYGHNSPRVEAWMEAESTAHPETAIHADRYRNWFFSRSQQAREFLGRP